MKLKKAEKFLKKINKLFESLKEEEELSQLELDLMREYTRKFYRKIGMIQSEMRGKTKSDDLSKSDIDCNIEDIGEIQIEEYEYNVGSIQPKSPKQAEGVRAEKIVQEVKETVAKVEEIEIPAADVEVKVDESPVIPEEPVLEEPVIEEPVKEELNIPSFELELADDTVSTAVKVEKKTSVETKAKPKNINQYAELFNFEEISDLSQKLSSAPITDIRSSMGLNERVLTINELFGGNAMAFDKTIKNLNGLNSFEEAKNYLAETVIPEYNWNDESKLKKARVLLKLIRRRYN